MSPATPNSNQPKNENTPLQVDNATTQLPAPPVKPTPQDLAVAKRTHPAAAPESHPKKISRRSSKPIINWLQRKLAGTVKPKPVGHSVTPIGRDRGQKRASLNGPKRNGDRTVSSPLPSSNTGRNNSSKINTMPQAKRNTISLNEAEDATPQRAHYEHHQYDDQSSSDTSSLEETSMWSPNSNREADEDASLRPLPPSSPPSPSPSRSSSYLSDPRTFRSIAASTKPTTLMSIDLNGNGMAHIAQAPLTPTHQRPRATPHMRNSSTNTNPGLSVASITFSALPPTSSDLPSRPTSLLNPNSTTNIHSPQSTSQNVPLMSVQAPLHTSHHPRDNPRPSSPPLDNASVLTLASSAFAVPGTRPETSIRSTPLSMWGGAGDSVSHYGGGSVSFVDAESTSQFVTGEDERLDERDFDASVRALRPRSSRRGSWESEVSRWSARVLPGTPSVMKDNVFWNTPSLKNERERASVDIADGERKPTAKSTDAIDQPAIKIPVGDSTEEEEVSSKGTFQADAEDATPNGDSKQDPVELVAANDDDASNEKGGNELPKQADEQSREPSIPKVLSSPSSPQSTPPTTQADDTRK